MNRQTKFMEALKTSTPPSTNVRENNVEAIYTDIRKCILFGDFKPGDVLSENALAAEYGVSRTPIRQALQRLEFEELVVSKQGLGTIVTILDLISLKETHVLRLKLADLFGDLSNSIHVSEEDLNYLNNLLEECHALRTRYDPRELIRINMEFHERVMEYVGNRPLRQFFNQLYFQTNQLWLQLLPELDWDEEVKENEEEYLAIIQRLQENDMYGVGTIRRDHIERCFGRVLKYLGSK
jgi:DNA-binding GntR family transcriptional regulator